MNGHYVDAARVIGGIPSPLHCAVAIWMNHLTVLRSSEFFFPHRRDVIIRNRLCCVEKAATNGAFDRAFYGLPIIDL